MMVLGEVTGLRPNAEDVAYRLVILRRFVASAAILPPEGRLEALLNKLPAEEQEKFWSNLTEKVDRFFQELHNEPYWQYVSPWERKAIETGIRAMDRRERIAVSWRIEAAQALMWALGMIEDLPPYDEGAKRDLFKGKFPKEAEAFVAGARLREVGEIDKARDIAELWHWRSRTRQLIERGEVLKVTDKMRAQGMGSFDDIVGMAARKGAADGLFSAVVGDDFPVNGKAYRDLTDGEWAKVRSVTMERHFALNWLCGRAPGNRWDETPTGT